MTNEEITVRLTDHENEIGSLKHRMTKVEDDQQALHELTASVRELRTDQGYLKNDVGEIKDDVKSLMSVPAKRWEGLVDKLLFAVAGAVIAWLASGAPGA